MRRIKLVLALSALMVAMLVATAGPAMADHTNRHENRLDRLEDRHHDFNFCCHEFDIDHDFVDFDHFGFPFISVIDDIDTENVSGRNPLEGHCFPEDVDLDGFIAEWEIVCFV